MSEMGAQTMASRDERSIGVMFSAIAPRYDILNRVLSLRRDVQWRRTAVASLQCKPGDRLLDVATGTADMLLEAAAQYGPEVRLAGVDLSAGMLRLGLGKLRRTTGNRSARLLAGSGLALPYRNGAFDAACISFGIRNVRARDQALGEMARVLRPGGRLAVLEFASETEPVLAGLYSLYLRHVLPRVGGLLSGNSEAYRYLHESVVAFPASPAFCQLIAAAGFAEIQVKRLTFGIANLFTARKS